MTEEDIRKTLNDVMLAKARVASAGGHYAEAFEYIAAVRALNRDYVEADALLRETAYAFITGSSITSRFGLRTTTWKHDLGRYGSIDDVVRPLLNLSRYVVAENDAAKRDKTWSEMSPQVDFICEKLGFYDAAATVQPMPSAEPERQ